ncbi:sigma 54-interacting transcriptional regulator [Anaerovoracaceae bacterium 41-7]
MIELANIKQYVQKMAHLISIVLEMNVTICDRYLNVLGDWNSQQCFSETDFRLKNDSVISTAILKKEVIIFNNAKEESAGCLKCSRRLTCNTEGIIAYPLVKGDVVLGGIGIYSEGKHQKDKLITQQNSMIEFVASVAELIIRRLDEEIVNLQVISSNNRMNRIVETLDFALVSLDEKNRIQHCNNKFFKLVENSIKTEGMPIEKVFPGMSLTGDKEHTFWYHIKRNSTTVEYEVTYSPVLVEGRYTGALLYFKEAALIFSKANSLLQPVKNGSFDEIIGSSFSIQKVKSDAEKFATSSSNILIQGESGTGKEIFATAIHNSSKCAEGPFVAVNCAAIPDNLLESELFGYEEGAFTGAAKGGRAGKFEVANKGTLFLDEIGELPIHLQPKLLRAIQEKKIQRVGSNRLINIDIRIITATNRDLVSMMKTGEFREDLYYRLSVIPIRIPSLRERKEDISVLAEYFLTMYRSMLQKHFIRGFNSSSMETLCHYDWPGNVRELQNAVEYAVNKCGAEFIDIGDLPERIIKASQGGYRPVPMKEMETEAIRNALNYFGHTPEGKEQAAESLGISRATMYRKLKEYGFNVK